MAMQQAPSAILLPSVPLPHSVSCQDTLTGSIRGSQSNHIVCSHAQCDTWPAMRMLPSQVSDLWHTQGLPTAWVNHKLIKQSSDERAGCMLRT